MLPNLPLLSGEFTYNADTVSIGATEWDQIIPADPTRWSIGFTAGQMAAYMVNVNPTLSQDWGWLVNQQGPVEFHYKDWGPMVQAAWYGWDKSLAGLAMYYASYIRKIGLPTVNDPGVITDVS